MSSTKPKPKLSRERVARRLRALVGTWPVSRRYDMTLTAPALDAASPYTKR
jgi:hypothetical protein